MMFSNSNSEQGEGAVHSNNHSASVVTPDENRGVGEYKTEFEFV